MSGTVTVRKTEDWLTPFEVEVHPEGGKPATARFTAPAKAQTYALAHAAEGLDLVYDLGASRSPMNNGNREISRSVSVEEFQARYQRVCAKCRTARTLSEFRQLTHRNRTTGVVVPHGYAERCLDCEAAHGE